MGAFTLMEPDAFTKGFQARAGADSIARFDRNNLSTSGETNRLSTFSHVRRPTRGIQIKNDTYATIEVTTANGVLRPLIDSGGEALLGGNADKGFSNRYSNFLLQRIRESRMEKAQIVETFGEPYIFFYGEHPRIIDFQGVLLNTQDFNWRAEFWANYETELRGTACVRNKARVTLSWDDVVVQGYMLDATAEESAEPQNLVIPFSFKLFITAYENISDIGSNVFPIEREGLNLNPLNVDISNGLDTSASSTLKVHELNNAPTENSLLQNLRDGISEVLLIQGHVRDAIQTATQLLFGRQVRVPQGFTGAAAFDIQNFETQTTKQLIWPVKFGHIFENIDEYVARVPDLVVQAGGLTLFDGQKAFDDQLIDHIKAAFTEAGISIDPPNELLQLAASAAFGAVSLGVGMIFPPPGERQNAGVRATTLGLDALL